MDFCLFLGVDSAKEKYDLAIRDASGQLLEQLTLPNQATPIQDWLAEWEATYAVPPHRVLCCVENTGWYHLRLVHYLAAAGCAVWVEDAYQLSRSMGRVRGKNDRIDAQRIAEYAWRHQDQARLNPPDSPLRLRLRSLFTQRRRIQSQLGALSVPIGEEAHCSPVDLSEQHRHSQLLIHTMRNQIRAIEQDIETLIQQDQRLARQRDIIRSVPGFGPVTSWMLLLITDGFSRYTNGRQLAAHCGVAPFARQSGKALNRKPRTSSIANKQLKTLLTMGARSLIPHQNPFAEFYRKKREQGKHHLVALNAVRNKMIHTVCACLRDDTMYQENYHLSLHKP